MSAPIAALKTAAESELAAHYAAARATLGGDLAARDAAFAQFAKAGLPHRRIESWHYTDLRARMRRALAPVARPDAAAMAAAKAAPGQSAHGVRIVLLDGFYQPGLSALTALPASIRIDAGDAQSPLALSGGALADPVAALNRAFSTQTLKLTIAADAKIEAPIEIVHLHSVPHPASAATQLRINVGARAQATVIETRRRLGSGALALNDLVSLDIADHAHLHFISTCDGHLGETTQALLTLDARLGAHAQFDCFSLITGGALVRRQVFAAMAGPHARLGLRGLSLLRGAQHADTTLVVDHAAPGGESREFFRHIIDDEATGVFQGKIIVRPGAQKTDGGMKSNALLLGADAAMMNKPELEIFADDVVCGHGATCGELDGDHLFYIMARGIPRAEAEAMLLEAFAVETIEGVGDQSARDDLHGQITSWLAARGAKGRAA